MLIIVRPKATWVKLSTSGETKETNPGVIQNTMFSQNSKASNMTLSYLI